MRILIVGAGGVGGYFGALLARSGQDVTFLARGDHLRAMQLSGLRVESPHGSFTIDVPAVDRVDGLPPQDLFLFCVKTYDTEAAARAIAPTITAEGPVLSLQNGVDSEETIGSVVGSARLLGGAARVEAAIAAPGVVEQRGPLREIVFGEPDGRETLRARRALEAFQAAGIVAELTDSIEVELWRKFITLASMSGLTTVCRASIGEVLACERTRSLAYAALREANAVGVVSGVLLPADLIELGIEYLHALPYDMKSSMQRDAERGKRLEIESLSGAVVRRGKRLGVAVPTHEFIYSALLPMHLRAAEALGS